MLVTVPSLGVYRAVAHGECLFLVNEDMPKPYLYVSRVGLIPVNSSFCH